MSDTITCPNCSCEIEITEVMSAQLTAQIRTGLEEEYAEKKQKIAADRKELVQLKEDLETRQRDIDEQIRQRLAKERDKLLESAKKEAHEELAVELKDRDERLKGYQAKLDAAQQQELDLRKKQRLLEEQAQSQELEMARKLDAERQSIRDAVLKKAQEEHQFKQAENDQRINSLLKEVDVLKRKLEQGSQQTQGEVQEIALEQLLAERFPTDSIEPVPKGVKGCDVIQRVFDTAGRKCGIILWESKRTKNWSEGWLSKLRDDQQAAKASCACIVSSIVPEEIDHFGEIDGIWVTKWPCVLAAGFALRSVLIETAHSKLALVGRQGKMELVYHYLAGPEFRNRVRGIAEAFVTLQQDLDAEKRAFEKQWNKRAKQLDRAMISTTGLWGDLQGIIGGSLKEIECMDLLALEGNGEQSEELTKLESE